MARELTGVVLKEKWRIDALLGEGGVAAVYAATHRNGKRVAVKILHPHLASIAEVRDRFLREGYLANRIEHPGAVSVMDDDTTADGLVFLVMELLEGESLEKRLERERRLPPADVLSIADNLLDVLAAAHAKGIVHRDIKPENVYLVRGGGQRLLDFGIARLHEQTAAKNATQSGAAMGTPSYMPPEQARGRWELVDARSDVWAVGATMFALLTGRCVHEAETVNETLLLAMAQRAPPLASVWPAVPPPIAAIVDRALAFDMKDRWPDAASMREAVQRARQALIASPSPAPLPLPAAPSTTMAVPGVTPFGGQGTVIATTVSTTVGQPAAGSFLATTRGRIAVAASIGGVIGIIAVALVLVVGRGKPDARPAAMSLSTPPAAASVSPPAAPPSAPVLAAGPAPAAPSASVEVVDVSQLPVASTATATGAPPASPPPAWPAAVRPTAVTAIPAPATPIVHSDPWSTPAPTPAPAPAPAKPPASPTSNPLLDRRH